MKILLVAVNAKYIHSNLAIYSLKAYVQNAFAGKTEYMGQEGRTQPGKDVQIELAEYTINQTKDEILMDLYRRRPDVLCFSCYIWNLSYVEDLVRDFGKLRPDVPIWLGGPEVSYDAEKVLARLPQVKGVMKGEGEETFAELCRIYGNSESGYRIGAEVGNEAGAKNKLRAGNELKTYSKVEESDFENYVDVRLCAMNGITFRQDDGQITARPWRKVMDLSRVPFVYTQPRKYDWDFEHKIVYYESSRGCPFSCSYCLSSIDKQLRFRDLKLVKQELQYFIDRKVPQVKFVDRTFNCRQDHAMEIWQYIMEHDKGKTNFHFEIAADLLKEEELRLLGQLRPGLVQLEIGVQSTNPDTIREIRRVMDFERVKEVVNRIREKGNIHQHLDLIAGLPYEDIKSFAQSFDDVYALKPEQLQLGFLKVLKGSYMETQKEAYGLVCKNAPPYEVLYTRWLSYEDVVRLKGIEEMVEIYYNSRQFTHTMEALEQEYESAFFMYDELRIFYEEKGYGGIQHKRSARYEILLEYISGRYPAKKEYYRELLTYDYYLRENAKTRPEFAGEYKVSREQLRTFYEKEEQDCRYLPAYAGYDRNQMRRMTHLEFFPYMRQSVLFDYRERNPLNQEARTVIVNVGELFLANAIEKG